MTIGLLGRKIGMTQIFDESGKAIPVTVIQVGPCRVLQLRTIERDGYEAVQYGYLDKKRQRARRSERGHVAKLESKRSRERSAKGIEPREKPDCEPQKLIREIRGSIKGRSVGDQVEVGVFTDVFSVDVTATSIGRGTAGVMKRHNFSGQRATHGVKKVHRHAGGTGCSAYPGRTFKGRRMAGRYGGVKTTIRNLKVVRIDGENNLLLVCGAVPGPSGGYVTVQETNRLPQPKAPPEETKKK